MNVLRLLWCRISNLRLNYVRSPKSQVSNSDQTVFLKAFPGPHQRTADLPLAGALKGSVNLDDIELDNKLDVLKSHFKVDILGLLQTPSCKCK